jgi:hypothetical protein
MESFIEAAMYASSSFFRHSPLTFSLFSFEEQQLTGEIPIAMFLSKRQIATMSPRLGILNNIPFAIPFEVRVSIFRHFDLNDKMSKGLTDGQGLTDRHCDL